jgi:hypothetical protein
VKPRVSVSIVFASSVGITMTAIPSMVPINLSAPMEHAMNVLFKEIAQVQPIHVIDLELTIN